MQLAEGVFKNDKIQGGFVKSFQDETKDYSGMFSFTSEIGNFQM